MKNKHFNDLIYTHSNINIVNYVICNPLSNSIYVDHIIKILLQVIYEGIYNMNRIIRNIGSKTIHFQIFVILIHLIRLLNNFVMKG